MQRRLEHSQERLAQLERDQADLRAALRDATKHLAQAGIDFSDAKVQEIDGLQASLAQRKATLKELRLEHQKGARSLKARQRQLGAKEDQKATCSETLESLTLVIARIDDEEVQSNQERLESARSALLDTQIKHTALQKELGVAQTEQLERQGAFDAWKATLAMLQSDAERALAAFKAKIVRSNEILHRFQDMKVRARTQFSVC